MRAFAKNLLSLTAVLIFTVLMGGSALAEGAVPAQSGFSAKGVVEAPDPVTVLAPMGGQVEDFAWIPGDRVAEGDLAFPIRPTQVIAPLGGAIVGLRAKPGDLAASVRAQYGALCYVEREDVWHIEASITSTSDKEETRDVRVGQVLRVQHGTGDDKVRGEGSVISVNGKEFVLEIEQGDFEFEDSVKVYLGTSKDNASADQIGSGKIVRAGALPAVGEGVVASVLVSEGEKVVRGQPLFILDGADARYGAGAQAQPEVRFPRSGVIGEALVGAGQFVRQGQAVMTLWPADALTAVLEVDELDIAKVRVGDNVRVHVDAYAQERAGTVREIRPVGRVVLDTTKFLVEVSFEKSDDLMIGMHVTGYWD